MCPMLSLVYFHVLNNSIIHKQLEALNLQVWFLFSNLKFAFQIYMTKLTIIGLKIPCYQKTSKRFLKKTSANKERILWGENSSYSIHP